jgi:hypothetical protein
MCFEVGRVSRIENARKWMFVNCHVASSKLGRAIRQPYCVYHFGRKFGKTSVQLDRVKLARQSCSVFADDRKLLQYFVTVKHSLPDSVTCFRDLTKIKRNKTLRATDPSHKQTHFNIVGQW